MGLERSAYVLYDIFTLIENLRETSDRRHARNKLDLSLDCPSDWPFPEESHSFSAFLLCGLSYSNPNYRVTAGCRLSIIPS